MIKDRRIVATLLAMMIVLTVGTAQATTVVGFEEGFLVVQPEGGLVYVDFNGVTAPIAIDSTADLRCLCAVDGAWVAGGADGTLLRSTDGRNWTPVSSPVHSPIIALQSFQGTLYGVTSDAQLLTSTDQGEHFVVAPDPLPLTGTIVAMAASTHGALIICDDSSMVYYDDTTGKWQPECYNELYQKYAPPIQVTGAYATKDMIYVYGVYPGTRTPFVQQTYSGRIWQTRDVRLYDLEGRPYVHEAVPTAMVEDSLSDQTLLLFDDGAAMTFTICEHCNTITQLSNDGFTDGAFWFGYVATQTDTGRTTVHSYTELRQNRISVEQTYEEMARGAIVIDVNSEETYRAKHVLGARHIPLAELKTRLPQEVESTDTLLIFYCVRGGKAQIAVETALEMGYTRAYSFGGISDWPYETEGM